MASKGIQHPNAFPALRRRPPRLNSPLELEQSNDYSTGVRRVPKRNVRGVASLSN